MLTRPRGAERAGDEQVGHPRRTPAAPIVLLTLLTVAAPWLLASIYFVNGFDFWFGWGEARAHFLINCGCIVGAAVYAARAPGGLDYKLSQALLAVCVLFGLYATAILAGRLFFSRPLFVSSFACSTVVSTLIVALRHSLTRTRVAILAPLMGATPTNLPQGQVITDPDADLRGFDVVLVSLNESLSANWSKAISRAMLAGCKVRHVSEYTEELRGAVALEHFEVEHLPPGGIASYAQLKRLIDVGMAVFVAPVALPLILMGGLAVLVTGGAPAFFVQERVGLGGRTFRMWKLRTMRPKSGDRAAVPGDARVTVVGRFLRRFRIDELPQFWNVLKGDMSLIGPRPETVALHEQYINKLPNYAYRYLVRPGITGWAQVSVAPSANVEEARHKLRYDLFYVKRLSLYLDIQIICRTFWTITAGRGAR